MDLHLLGFHEHMKSSQLSPNPELSPVLGVVPSFSRSGRASPEMDIQEWELLSVDGFLDFHGDGEVKLSSPKRSPQSKSVLDSDYFRCPSPNSWSLVDPPGNRRVRNQFVPVAVQLDPMPVRAPDPDCEGVKEITKLPIHESAVITAEVGAPAVAEDQDLVSHVSFKKTKETNEFVDLTMDTSPRYGGVRGIVPPIEAFCFQERGEKLERPFSPRMKNEKREVEKKMDPSGGDDGVSWEENKGGLKMFKWGVFGIGALCSFGVVAAATCCILILGSRHGKDKQNNPKHNLKFHFYADDKRIKQVVHHATKLNDAMSAVRGVPFTGAHITFGGHYDGL